MVNDVFKVKSEIIPLQAKETVVIKKNLDNFLIKVNNYRKDFLENLPFDYTDNMTNEEIASQYKIIDSYYKKTCDMEKEAQDYNNLEKLFEL
jgi:hypothetical protein